MTGKDHEGVLGVPKMFCFHLVSDNTHGKYSTCVTRVHLCMFEMLKGVFKVCGAYVHNTSKNCHL